MFSVGGFYRLQIINPDGTIDSDTGFKKNVVTAFGIENICAHLANCVTGTDNISATETLASESVSAPAYIALGSGTGPLAFNDQTLYNELNHAAYSRQAFSKPTFVHYSGGNWNYNGAIDETKPDEPQGIALKTTFEAPFVDSAVTLKEIGIFNTSEADNPDLLAGSTYNGILVGADQQIQVTYIIAFQQT